MATGIPMRELGYGAAEIFSKETLGVGSYGKVCKAKCGQLPCAAKLLHDTMFDTDDPGIHQFVERFEQECDFLRMIKHPNIVQFLGTSRDPQSRRLALLMELMDESLTRFLERSTGSLLHHIQLNICHDVALALAYLHSNDIIHRDLSSNNVLLIGEGSRAKVTDFGMSKLVGMNPRMTPLTMCPGTLVYMPPEALITPPRYSSKLDCFSHGVLTIQIATRQFPNPGDAHVEDPNEGLLRQVPEIERRKKDVDLMEPDHPLLPLALHCLELKATDRPSADELCGRLATLKCEPKYTHSVEQSREQNAPLQTLQQQLQQKDDQLEKSKANHEIKLHECQSTFQQQIQDIREEAKSYHETELRELQQQLQEKDSELERARKAYEKEINAKDSLLNQAITDRQAKRLVKKEGDKMMEEIHEPAEQESNEIKFEWKRGEPIPEGISAPSRAAVLGDNIVYFSIEYRIYSYSSREYKYSHWTKLTECDYKDFGMAVVNNKLTTIGGRGRGVVASNLLLCLSGGSFETKLLPPMKSQRIKPAAVTTPTHLVVAGGQAEIRASEVEILNLDTLQWSSSCSSTKKEFAYPNMTFCGGYLYLSEHDRIFSCSVEELLKSCEPNSSVGGSVWTRLADIPARYWTSLATLRGRVVAVGGCDDKYDGNLTGAIHCYDRSTNSWSVVGEMPTPRCQTLVAVLPNNDLIVVGGLARKQGAGVNRSWLQVCCVTEIGD